MSSESASLWSGMARTHELGDARSIVVADFGADEVANLTLPALWRPNRDNPR